MCTRVHKLLDHTRTRVQQMLAVVEDQQQLPVPKGGYQCVSNCLVGTLADTYRVRYQVWHQGRIGDWRQLDEPDTVWIALQDRPSHFQREPCLAATADTCQRQQARVGEPPNHLLQFLVATDK